MTALTNNNALICLLIIFGVFLFIIWQKQREGFATGSQCKNYKPGDISHCPRACTPFLHPEMYQPHASCSDPLNWGFTYGTGRCPHAYYPVPRRLPSPPTEEFTSAPWLTHGGGASYDDSKHMHGPGYTRAYNYA